MISYDGNTYPAEPGETVLTCLERHGVSVPSFCRNGACQTCLLKVTEGIAPPKAQIGLKESWKRQGFVLSCVCETTTPLTLAPADAAQTHRSRVIETRALSGNVVSVRVSRPGELAFEGGQFVQLGRPADGVARPYSIASLPSDDYLEFHIAVYPDGALSPWLANAAGQEVSVMGPFGECTYVEGEPERPLVLAGTGTGLAPLVAVLRAAVAAQHRGPIVLYHGARTPSDLYFWQELHALRLPPNVSLRGVFQEEPVDATSVSALSSLTQGDLVQTLLREQPKPEPARIYLCGNPTFVQTLKKRLYIAGASLSRIHSDPFLPRGNAP